MDRRKFIHCSLTDTAIVAIPGLFGACSTVSKTEEMAFIDRLLPAPKNGGFRDDGVQTVQNHFERAFVLVEDGKPTHLYAAVGEGPRDWRFENTWNMVIPLKS